MLTIGTFPFAALGTLLLVIGGIFAAGRAARLLPQRLRAPSAGPLRIVGVLPIDTRRRLYLIAVNEGAVLILTGGPADRMLSWPPSLPA